eukprot:441904-Heterocapsa_arctica.AAC.1
MGKRKQTVAIKVPAKRARWNQRTQHKKITVKLELNKLENKRSADDDENKEMGKAKQARIKQDGQSMFDKRAEFM